MIYCFAFRSHHPLVTSTVEGIKQLAQRYGKAINVSLDVAQKGNCFSEYAIELSRFLRRDKVDQVQAHEFLRAMSDIAEDVHRDAGDMNKQFREVRVGIMQACLFFKILQVLAR